MSLADELKIFVDLWWLSLPVFGLAAIFAYKLWKKDQSPNPAEPFYLPDYSDWSKVKLDKFSDCRVGDVLVLKKNHQPVLVSGFMGRGHNSVMAECVSENGSKGMKVVRAKEVLEVLRKSNV